MLRGLLHVGTVLLSSLLLFLIQPMMGKIMLPWFGGSAGVWTTAMLFFQAALFLGYVYAHWTTRVLSPRAQATIHLLLLGVSLLALPVAPWKMGSALTGSEPALRIAFILAVSIGLPFFLLASTSPLVQAWAAGRAAKAPIYRLYALSNLASLCALLLYPMLIEPRVATREQLLLWSVAYGGFVLLAGAESVISGFRAKRIHDMPSQASLGERLLWIALAACPSVLWLATANMLSQNLAPVPLLWILPLGIYLLSLVVCFDREGWYRPGFFRGALPVSWIVMGYGLMHPTTAIGLKPQVALFSAALLVCCLFCHGELVRRKPPTGTLTLFYVNVATGGVLGGLFVGVAAPGLFNQFLELPIGVAACAILGMSLLYRLPLRQVARLGVVGAAGLLLASALNDAQLHTRARHRNFYGSLQMSEVTVGDSTLRVLSSGTVQHGSQFIGEARGRRATAYYGPESGVALTLRCLGDRRLRVALIGLGAGALAVYARQGDEYRFYELNPAVTAFARGEFRYLGESAGHVEVVEGDGRLLLEREHGAPFDAIVVDAFSGDSIPAHLLTREAFATYFARQTGDGVVAVHITNRYVDLEGVVRGAAEEAGRTVLVVQSPANAAEGTHEAVWMMVTRNQRLIEELKLWGHAPDCLPRIWTDDYSDLFSVLR